VDKYVEKLAPQHRLATAHKARMIIAYKLGKNMQHIEKPIVLGDPGAT
jgi:hypothetical protein